MRVTDKRIELPPPQLNARKIRLDGIFTRDRPAMIKSNPFKWRHYQSEIILLCVRWYLRYALSYRDLEEMMEERGLSLDHTTIYR
jgi:transposase, IS6 family